MKKRILCIFFALLFCLGCLPAAGASAGRDTVSLREAVTALERERLPAGGTAGDYAALMPEVETLVAQRDDFVPGSIRYDSGILFWQTADGDYWGYSPEERAQRTAAAEEADGGNMTAAELTGDPAFGDGDCNMAFLSPFYGIESMFNLNTLYTIQEAAAKYGGDYVSWLGRSVTIDRLAAAMESCSLVIWEGHGSPGYIVLTSQEGITEKDREPDPEFRYGHWLHAYRNLDDGVNVDGVVICSHMKKPAPDSLFFNGSCSGMSEQGLCGSLLDCGVAVVGGWTRAVTGKSSDYVQQWLTASLAEGRTVAEAVTAVKRKMASAAKLSDLGEISWDWIHYTNGPKAARTEQQAIDRGVAFLIFTGDEDPYPADVQRSQTVRSSWKLPVPENRDIEQVLTVGREFRLVFTGGGSKSTFPVDLVDGQLPPGMGLRATKDGKTYIPELYGRPTVNGLYEATVRVALQRGGFENRKVRLLVTADPEKDAIAWGQKEQVFAGEDLDLALDLRNKSKLFYAETLEDTNMGGLTLLWDETGARLCGTLSKPGNYTGRYRVWHMDGQIWDHTVTIRAMGEVSERSDGISIKTGVLCDYAPDLGDVDSVESIVELSGALPPGLEMDYSMSERPHVHGSVSTPGEYSARYRIVTGKSDIIYYTLTVRIYAPAEYLDFYTIDLSLGSCRVPKADFDSYLFNAIYYGVRKHQMNWDVSSYEKSGWIGLDVDMDGSYDLSIGGQEEGYVIFNLLKSASLSGDNYAFTLGDEARDEIDESGEGMYARQIVFHLLDHYDLYVDGTEVTSRNRGDVLGNGVFSFDGGTLTVDGDYSSTGSEPLIRNGIDGLTVRTEADSALSCWGNCIETEGSLTLEGPGQLSLNSSGNSGIVCEKALLEIYNTTLMIRAAKKGIAGTGDGSVHARADRANVSVRSGEGAMDGFWSIGMYNCMVTSPTGGGKGTVGSRACLVDADGQLLTNARITAYDKKYDLMIDGVWVTDRNRDDVLGDGTFSFDGDRTLTISRSYEDAKNVIVDSNIGLVICAAPDTVLRTTAMSCFSLAGNTMLTGGPLTVISENKYLSQGISLQNDSTLFVCEMDLTVRGNRRGINGGSDSGKGRLDVWASNVTVSGPTTALWVPGGLELEQCILEEPKGGAFDETDGKVYDALGDTASEVSIRSFRTWELYIAGTQVTQLNMEDVLGDGTFSFDGKHTLTVKGDCGSEYGIIESYVAGLDLFVEKDARLETGEGGDPIYAGADLTVTGPGKLTLVSGCTAAVIQRGGSVLTIRDADVTARGPYGFWGGEGDALIVDNSAVTVSGTDGAILGLGKGITFTGCEITSPAGAVIKDGAVVTSGGEVCGEVAVAPVVHVTGVSLSKTSLTLAPGESASLKATVQPADARDKSVTWSSSEMSVATVSSGGKVTAVDTGTAVITVTTKDGGMTAQCTVTVKDPPIAVTGVTLDRTSLTLEAGGSGTLKVTVKPSDAADKTVTWSSSRPAVATVSSGGIVTAVAAGSAVITVKTADGGKTASCAVTVKEKQAQVEEGAISVIGGIMAYSVGLPESGGTARLVAAWYDENGALQGCAVKDGVALDGWKTGTITVEKGRKEYRLFVLDGAGGKPLIKALTTGG